MITVMKEKDDFSANLFLKTPGRDNLSEQKPLAKESARLLSETNNRVIHRSGQVSYPSDSLRDAKQRLLQDGRQDQHSYASNKIRAEITDTPRSGVKENKPFQKHPG